MGRIHISNLGEIYNELQAIQTEERQRKSEEGPGYLKEKEYDEGEGICPKVSRIALPRGHTLITSIALDGDHYAASMGLMGKTKDLKGFEKTLPQRYRTQRNAEIETNRNFPLKPLHLRLDKPPLDFYKNGPKALIAKRESNPRIEYKIRLYDEGEDPAMLRIFCGEDGLMPREMKKEHEFKRNIGELVALANMGFQRFLTSPGMPGDIMFPISFRF